VAINFQCKKCQKEFDCEMGKIGINEQTLHPDFEKPIICPRCGKRTIPRGCCLNGAGRLSWTCCRLARNTPGRRGTVMPSHNLREHSHHPQFAAHCCPCCDRSETADDGMTRLGLAGGVGGLSALKLSH